MFSVLLCVSESFLSLASFFVMMQLEAQSRFCVVIQVDKNVLLSVVKFSLFAVLGKNLLK